MSILISLPNFSSFASSAIAACSFSISSLVKHAAVVAHFIQINEIDSFKSIPCHEFLKIFSGKKILFSQKLT